MQYADVSITSKYTNKPTLESGKLVYFYSVHTVTAESAATASMRVTLFRNGSIHVKKCKVESGTKATDWSPAPEDIASVQTIATQTADKFNWLVRSGTSATDFTLTDRTATLVASAINLKGLVTFSGLDSTAQGKINTAQTTASNAATSAAAAQSTADTAKGNAEAAQSAADAARTAASNAQSTVNTANSTANAANSTLADWSYGNDKTYINGGSLVETVWSQK